MWVARDTSVTTVWDHDPTYEYGNWVLQIDDLGIRLFHPVKNFNTKRTTVMRRLHRLLKETGMLGHITIGTEGHHTRQLVHGNMRNVYCFEIHRILGVLPGMFRVTTRYTKVNKPEGLICNDVA